MAYQAIAARSNSGEAFNVRGVDDYEIRRIPIKVISPVWKSADRAKSASPIVTSTGPKRDSDGLRIAVYRSGRIDVCHCVQDVLPNLKWLAAAVLVANATQVLGEARAAAPSSRESLQSHFQRIEK